ncbi:MAG: single-strand selective monofunctional uracil-DNA glycosylase [Kiritimatiellaeota bacterium]|nr:single-strand selective monofunctional uracil-DNA glycosylase [Kiritimatiellota bacterium]
MVEAGRRLCSRVSTLRFGPPVAVVYNPLVYARRPYERYLELYGAGPKRVVFVGMNPGPFGMAQTGVPFGEVAAVRDFLKVQAPVGAPPVEHPKRPVNGFACPRSEVSGRRLWGAVRAFFGTPERFFADHFVANYCPLVFIEESGRNRTPDKLPAPERIPLFAACNAHLRRTVEVLRPDWVIGIGAFAEARTREAVEGMHVRVGRVLHPSPASPAANRGWRAQARAALVELGLCTGDCPED